MDTIAQMLVSIKNANASGKESVSLPYSNLRHAIAECLVKEGYIAGASKKTGKGDKQFLEIALSYEGKSPKLSFAKRVSKPSRRIYIKSKEIRPVKNGRGLLVVSTPKGVLSGEDAKKQLVGGEVLFKVW